MDKTRSMLWQKSWVNARSIGVWLGIIGSGVTFGAISMLSESAMALSAVEVGKIAKSVTVSIDSANSVGSGVVIKKDGNTYTVLTAAHVVCNRQQEFKLTTPDGKNYPLVTTNIKATADADLAIVKFQSSVNYPIGETIAIHGKGDVKESTEVSNVNDNIRIKTGFNLGIPTNTFMRLASQLGVNFGGKPPIVVAAIAPKAPQAVDFFLIGVDRFNRGNLGGSIAAMNAAIKLNPRYTKAYLARASANFMFKRIGAALADADLAIASDPKSAIAYAGKCFFLSEFGKQGEALGACDRALALAPQNAMTYNVRGLVGLRLGNYRVAAADLERSIDLDPKLYYAYNNLALVRLAQNNLLVALNLSRQAVQVAPQSSGARALLGQLLVLNRDYRQGLMELDRALGLNPQLAGAYEARAMAHQALGNTAQAKLDAQLAKQFALSNPNGFIDDISFLNQ